MIVYFKLCVTNFDTINKSMEFQIDVLFTA